MKLKDAQGNEVEVADDSPVAVAARELERVKGLGFDSIEAFTTAKDADVAALKKRTEEDQKFIDKQKGELGDLRKANETKPPEGGDGKPPEKKQETDEEREVRYQQLNSNVQENLTEEESAHAETEYKKVYEESTPDERALLKTHEGRNAFMQEVFPTKKTDDNAPVGLFEKKAPKTLSIAEQVQEVLRKDDTGRGRTPVIPSTTGSGFKAGGSAAPEKVVQRPLSRDGGVMAAMKQLDKQGA